MGSSQLDKRSVTDRRRLKRRAQAPTMLTWQTVWVEELNSVKVEVNKAIGRRGALYSFRLFRYDRGRESNYLRGPHDAGDSMEAIRRANHWIEIDRQEESGF